ncbi:MAG: hypothetical protein QW521_03415 [Desulfurococcaceae archaeon]
MDMIRDRYETKLPVMPRVYEVQTKSMSRNLPRMLDVFSEMEDVYKILDRYRIVGNFRIPYLNFARKLYHLKMRYGPEALEEAARYERAKYESMGLNREVLDAIVALFTGRVGGAGAGGAITIR